MKKSPAQLMEEEEPLQGKFETVQKVEEEEPLQGKFNTIQKVEQEELKVDDIGIGVFPPEPGATEPGAKYLELPSIMDQEEIEKMRELNRLNDITRLSIIC
jgi:hypothetical protein